MVGRRIFGVFGTLGAALLVPPDRALAAGSAYDHVFRSIDAKSRPLSDFRGQVVLVVRDGKLVAAFGTQTSPESPNLRAAIEAELAKPTPAAAAPAPTGTGTIDNGSPTNKDSGNAR